MDEGLIKNLLLNSDFYNRFSKQGYTLVSSDYITGKMLVVNNLHSYKIGTRVKTLEYYKNLGLKCDYSKEHQEYKNELSSLIRESEIGRASC